MSNWDTWDKLRTPPQDALKAITGGRLKGKSDINPQWRYQALTEVFGPCGTGWRYEVVRVWREDGADGEVMAFAEVNLYVEDSKAIPGFGGSMLVEKETRGLHNNDEAYKMAITDALGTAAKMLGVAADVYRGTNGGSKYITTTPTEGVF